MPRTPRNATIDAARASAVVVVVLFHAVLYEVRLTDGRPDLVPWAPEHAVWWPLSWVFLVIPVFFLAGGFVHAELVAREPDYATFLLNRTRKLAAPLLLFVTIAALVATVAQHSGVADAVALSARVMNLLWFLVVYLGVVAVAPWAVRAHDRAGVWVLVALAVLTAGVDAVSFVRGDPGLRNLNMALVWPLVHQLGVAWQRGWFRRWNPVATLGTLAGAIAGILVLVFALGYPGPAVGFADLPIANVQPPTLAMGFLGLAQVSLLGLIERWRASPGTGRPARLIRAINALMLTIYLWHLLAIAAAVVLLAWVSSVAPGASGWWLAQPSVALVTLGITAVLAPLIGRVEARLIAPLRGRPDAAAAVLAHGVLWSGTFLVWQHGTVLGASLWATAGVGLVWLGAWLIRRAARG